MQQPTDFAQSLIAALDEPALVVAGSRTLAANRAARDLLGQTIEGADVRVAIRHPDALRTILAAATRPLRTSPQAAN